MNIQMKKYRESLANTPEPVLLSQLSQRLDLRGLMDYAKAKGVTVAELSVEEKEKFLK